MLTQSQAGPPTSKPRTRQSLMRQLRPCKMPCCAQCSRAAVIAPPHRPSKLPPPLPAAIAALCRPVKVLLSLPAVLRLLLLLEAALWQNRSPSILLSPQQLMGRALLDAPPHQPWPQRHRDPCWQRAQPIRARQLPLQLRWQQQLARHARARGWQLGATALLQVGQQLASLMPTGPKWLLSWQARLIGQQWGTSRGAKGGWGLGYLLQAASQYLE